MSGFRHADFDLIEECITFAILRSHRIENAQMYWEAWHRIKDATRTPPERNSQPDASGVPKPEMTTEKAIEIAKKYQLT